MEDLKEQLKDLKARAYDEIVLLDVMEIQKQEQIQKVQRLGKDIAVLMEKIKKDQAP